VGGGGGGGGGWGSNGDAYHHGSGIGEKPGDEKQQVVVRLIYLEYLNKQPGFGLK